MVRSNWGDWYVHEEIEAANVEDLTLWFLGCNGFVLRTPGATVYVDPYFGWGDPPRTVRMVPVPLDPADATVCDAVLATHEHVDHMHPPSYGPLVNDLGADLYATEPCYETPQYGGDLRVPPARKHVIAAGDAFEVGDLTIHVRDANDPDASGEVSYVVEHGSGTFFHGGDGRPSSRILSGIASEFDLDLGALAFGSAGNIHDSETGGANRRCWYMDENEIVEAATQLELPRLLPTHSNMWRGMGADPAALHAHAITRPFPELIERPSVGDRFSVARPGTVPLRTTRDDAGPGR